MQNILLWNGLELQGHSEFSGGVTVDGVRKAEVQGTQGWDLGMSMVWGLQAQDKGLGESHPEEPKAERGEQLGRKKEGGEQLRGWCQCRVCISGPA